MSDQANIRSQRSERRRAPRVKLLGKLHGRMSLDVAVTVVDISLGGILIRTSVPLPVGGVLPFALTLGDGSEVLLKGRSLRTSDVGPQQGKLWETAFEFVDEDDIGGPDIAGLIEKVK